MTMHSSNHIIVNSPLLRSEIHAVSSLHRPYYLILIKEDDQIPQLPLLGGMPQAS